MFAEILHIYAANELWETGFIYGESFVAMVLRLNILLNAAEIVSEICAKNENVLKEDAGGATVKLNNTCPPPRGCGGTH